MLDLHSQIAVAENARVFDIQSPSFSSFCHLKGQKQPGLIRPTESGSISKNLILELKTRYL